jgi:hypothetical protein
MGCKLVDKMLELFMLFEILKLIADERPVKKYCCEVFVEEFSLNMVIRFIKCEL